MKLRSRKELPEPNLIEKIFAAIGVALIVAGGLALISQFTCTALFGG